MIAAHASDRLLDILYVGPARFRRSPQVGVPCQRTWRQLADGLSRANTGDSKDVAGAWSPARYRGDVRRKDHLVSIGALVVDVDDGGDVGRAALAVQRYRAVVHETFSSTAAAPRCRIVLALVEPINAETYEKVHAVVRAHLRASAFDADEAAKDASRLSYLPVRRPGDGYGFAETDGAPLNAAGVLAAQPAHRGTWLPPRNDRGGAYACGALRRAAQAVAAAREGARNVTLNRETYCLARLDGIDSATIEATMLDAALAAGLPEHEARRTIVGAIRARRGAP
jgi:hypothetical protein